MAAKSTARHSFAFFRAGGVDQVLLRDGADLAHLDELDLELWIALACPTRGLDVDEKTLALVDTDKDGRIRPPEILAAVAWAKDVWKDLDGLFEGGDSVELEAIDRSTDRGKGVYAGTRRVLASRGKPEAKTLTLADVTDTEALFASMRLNGDGVVPAESAEDEATRKAIEDAIAAGGSVPGRGDKPGLDAALAEGFFGAVAALREWRAKSHSDAATLPLGPATEGAFRALRAVEAKIDDWFARCRLAAFDSRAGALLGGTEAELAALAVRELTRDADEIARLPIARVAPGRPLPLADGANPAWTERLDALGTSVVTPLLGARDALAEAEWTALKERFAPYRVWLETKPATVADKLEPARLDELGEPSIKQSVLALIAEDAALAPELAQLQAVEQMVRYQRDLVRLLRNFVTFSEFYARKGAAFLAGTLFLDGRACALCTVVEDAGKHAGLAGLAKAYLAYCDCTRPAGEKLGIVAAFTGGDTDNLMVGRNGVFYDRKGRDWDATITKIIENPISVRQAFFTPYKRFVRLVEEQVAKRAAAAETQSTGKVDAAAARAASSAAAPAPGDKPAGAAPSSKVDVGTVAAIGVAVAGVATFASSILATFFGLGMWMPVGFAALLLAISGPSMLIAWLKLRQRNLGPILDAGGWAINGRVRINVPFGGSLTKLATLPPGAGRSLADPFEEKKRPVTGYVAAGVLMLLAVLWFLGKMDGFLPDKGRASTVLHRTPVGASAR